LGLEVEDFMKSEIGTFIGEVYVLTHEYHNHYQICGVTRDDVVVLAWLHGGTDNSAYKVPLDQIVAIHPQSEGWHKLKI